MINEKKAVLYVAYETSFTVNAAIHKCNEHKESFSILITNTNCNLKYMTKIFNKVIIDYGPWQFHFNHDCTSIEKNVNEYYQLLLKNNNLNLEDIDVFYTSGDVGSDFAMFLSINKIKHYYVEVAYNQLNNDRSTVYDWHINNKNPHGSKDYFLVSKKYLSCCGNSEYVIKKIVFKQSLDKETKYKNYIEYDFYKNIQKLSNSEKNNLIRSFVDNTMIKQLTKLDCCNLLLTQRQWKSNLSDSETGILYQTLVDYFSNNKGTMLIKPHPSDKYDHKIFFNNSIIIPPSVPADIIPLFDTLKINDVLTISSTSIDKFEYVNCNRIILSDLIFKEWKNLTKIVMSIILGKSLNLGDICRNGVDYQIINMLSKYCRFVDNNEIKWQSLECFNKGTIIVGSIVYDEYLRKEKYNEMLKSLKNGVIIFQNFEEAYFEDVPELLSDVYPIEITKTPISKNCLCDCNNEYLFIYSPNRENIKKIESFKGITLNELKIYVTLKNVSDTNKKIITELYKTKIELKKLNNKIKELESKNY